MTKKIIGFVFFLVAIFSLFPSQVEAREKPRIAVVDIKYESDRTVGKQSTTLIVNKIASDLVSTGRFDVLERIQIEDVLKEQNFLNILAGKDEFDYQKIGELLSAEAVITGTAYYGERTIVKKPSAGLSPAQLMLGLIFPPFLFIQPSPQEPYTVKVSSYSLAVNVVDVKTGKIIASEDLLESDLGNIGDMTKRLYVKLLASYPVRGKIIEIEGKDVYVDLGRDLGLEAGDILEIYKPEKPIKRGAVEVMSLPEEKIGEIAE